MAARELGRQLAAEQVGVGARDEDRDAFLPERVEHGFEVLDVLDFVDKQVDLVRLRGKARGDGLLELLRTADVLEAPLVEIDIDDVLRRNALAPEFLHHGEQQAGFAATADAGDDLDQVRPVERPEFAQIRLAVEDGLFHGNGIYRKHEEKSS